MDVLLIAGVVVQLVGSVVACWSLVDHGRRDGGTP